MLEADVIDSGIGPIMAHPPDTTSDITLAEWLDKVSLNVVFLQVHTIKLFSEFISCLFFCLWLFFIVYGTTDIGAILEQSPVFYENNFYWNFSVQRIWLVAVLGAELISSFSRVWDLS